MPGMRRRRPREREQRGAVAAPPVVAPGEPESVAEPAERPPGRMARLAERAARLDSGPRKVRAARALRAALPGDRTLGEPVAGDPGAPAEIIAQRLAALGERPSAAREAGLTVVQLLQHVSEAQGRGRGERDVAILFTDLVEFSPWALEVGDAVALRALAAAGSVVERAVRVYDGTVVKRLGDGVMAAFGDAAAAVRAACDAQAGVHDLDLDGYRPRMRAGVHVGRPRRLGRDYLGVDVNIAARVVDASRDEIAVSEPVLAHLDDAEFEASRRLMLSAKGIPADLRVFSVRRRG
jgi:adenylate cyclase